jgi:hypothetical protein
VSGDKELLDGHKTVEDTPSDMSDNVNYEVPVSLNSPDASDIRTSSEGAEDRGGEDNHPEDSVVAKECKYTFQMPLPPSGTHAYEEDLSFTMREVPPEESSTGLGGEFLAKELRKTAVEELCADSSKWQTVRAVLTSERILHLYSNEPAETNRGSTVSDSGAVKGGEGRHYGGSITQLPMKSINCRRVGSCVEGVSGGGEGASIRRSYYAGQEDEEEEEEEEDDSPAARCFEIISKQNTSLMKSFNLFGSNKSKSTSDHFLFQAQDKRALEIWLKILRDDSVNLGDPIAIATCVDTPHYSDEDEEGADDGDYDEDDRDSVSAQAIEQLLKLAELPEIEEVRTSIFRAASDIDDEEGGVDYGEDDDNDNGTGGSEN